MKLSMDQEVRVWSKILKFNSEKLRDMSNEDYVRYVNHMRDKCKDKEEFEKDIRQLQDTLEAVGGWNSRVVSDHFVKWADKVL